MRKLKPYKVDEVRTRGAAPTPIYLDRENHNFFATVGGERLEALTAVECRKLARAAVERSVTLEWEQGIELSIDTSAESWSDRKKTIVVDLGFRFRRFERARRQNNADQWVERDFTEAGAEPDGPDHWSAHCPSEDYRPYSEPLWACINAVAEATRLAKKRLDELLAKKNVDRLLAMGPQLLLAAGVVDLPPTKKRKIQ